jgi:hypothetical protein
MRRLLYLSLLAGALVAPVAVRAQDTAVNYKLTPSWRSAPHDLDGAPRVALFQLGGVTLGSGGGLSLQAGQQWFARASVGSTLLGDTASVGGGYRFRDGDSLSMHVTRQLGHDGLGLAVRYDRAAAYLRLSYEARLGQAGQADMLRFQAGMRF